MSRNRGSGQGCIGRPEARRVPLPVSTAIRVSKHCNPFVGLEFDEFERTGADWTLSHVARLGTPPQRQICEATQFLEPVYGWGPASVLKHTWSPREHPV
jgi:hypothetical protein